MNLAEASIKYERQRYGAARRGIGWEFTFDEWVSVWAASGKWDERGKGGYVMARHGDVGPYAVGNVAIITGGQNTADAHANGRFPVRVVQRIADMAFDRPPVMVPAAYIDAIPSYRAAVRACWEARRVTTLTQRSMAELIGAYSSHVSDYLNADDAAGRRDLPAGLIADFEWICGNHIVTQWLAEQSGLPVAEESIATARAAA